MNRIYRIGLLLWSVVCAVPVLYAQTVSDIIAKQVGKNIHVSYDLDEQANITLFVSTDGGRTYSQLDHVSGDVGENVPAGHRTIVWNVLAERDDFIEKDVVFKIRAYSSSSTSTRDEKDKMNGQGKSYVHRNHNSFFLTLNGSYSPFPQWAYGFKIGQIFSECGWFISGMSNFQFEGMYNYFENDSYYSLNGKHHGIRLSGQIGFVLRPWHPVSFLFGVGYGYRSVAYQTTDDQWFSCPKNTIDGVDASVGFLFDMSGFTISAEVVSTNFATIEARVGIGFCITTR